ncbi:MAG: DUF3604 domain-containing protein [Myxococcota bacterium]
MIVGWVALIACAPPPAHPIRGEPDLVYGTPHGPGYVTPKSRPRAAEGKQILFGDMHVHTTYSVDAYRISLPLFQAQGEGPYPVGGACDFARFCAGLDFWGLTDHANSFTPRNWKDAKESVRQCNAVAGDPANPDLVTFMGFEWTQVGMSPADHYGHHNVHFLYDSDDQLPARPIAATGRAVDVLRGYGVRIPKLVSESLDPENREYYHDFNTLSRDFANTPSCDEGVDTRLLPLGCFESTATPAELMERLDQWGFDRLVIPHGSVWGLYVPELTSWDKQLNRVQRARDLPLVEIYSGHGNAERYFSFRPREIDATGNPVCPAPTRDYLPICWQAGELIRGRCVAEGLDAAECDGRAAEARAVSLAYGAALSHLTVPGSTGADWLDAGQARGAFKPAFNYRPMKSVQYALAATDWEDPNDPLRFRWGFIGSSDNHRGRPGAGAFKEFDRANMTDSIFAGGFRSQRDRDALWGPRPAPSARAAQLTREEILQLGFGSSDMERLSSFFTTSGLAAVHAAGRSREQIWDAMQQREVYATSGPRILLWFDLLNAPDGEPRPMGSEVEMSESPHFGVRAAGGFVQQPGCPDYAVTGLPPERLARLCHDECYHPSDERYAITRIEVVRIRSAAAPGLLGTPESRIEDPWLVFPCDPNAGECLVEFDDPEFASGNQDALYYVRAIQEPTDAINGARLRPTFDAEGNAVSTNPCYGDYRTDPEDECLSPVEERAWASPIYVDRS